MPVTKNAMIGEVIDEKYKITRLVGEGGMGAVYEGENLLIARRVAIKVLHAAMALNQQTVERFQREARAAGRIGNDHILEVLDLGKLPNGDHYMVLEYLDGEPLSKRIERLGKMLPVQISPIITQVLAGLAAAHSAGIIHRDLKPDNIFVLKEKAGHKDFVKIIDFGISKFSPLAGEDKKRMTQTGAIMGTPYYMSPEQARGSLDADARSDLYSVGVIIYEAVTGQVPFDGQTVNELMFNIALSDPRPLREFVPDIDPDFEKVLDTAMAKDRDKRYQTADEFLQALKKWCSKDDGRVSALVGAQAYTGSMPKVLEPNSLSPDAQVSAKASAGASQPIPAATSNSWATSQMDASTLPTKSPTPLIVGATIGALLLLAGAGTAAYMAFSGGGAPQDPAEPDAAGPAAETAETVPFEEPPPAEPKVEPATEPKAEEKKEEKPEAKEPDKEAKKDPEPQTKKPPATPKVKRRAKRTAPRPKTTAKPPATTKQEPKTRGYSQFGY